MKHYLWLISFLLFSVCVQAQEVSHRYFDRKGEEVSKAEQRKIFDGDRGGIISVPIDSGAWVEHRLVPREEKGKLNVEQTEELTAYLGEKYPLALPSKFQAAILFYPGKDESNSTGGFDRNDYARLYDGFEKKLKRLKTAYPFYIYKDDTGLERQSKNRNWQNDSGQLVERFFFRYRYPGGSYVVVDSSGNYSAYFGEFAIEDVVETVRKIKRLL